MAKKFRVTVDGETFEVEVEEVTKEGAKKEEVVKKVGEVKEKVPVTPPPPLTPKPTPPKKEVEVPPGSYPVTAPLPGKIVSINVKEGNKVKEGDLILIIEAMKMENEIYSPVGGIVKDIKISPGDVVEVGATLLILETGS
ncbi:MAG TPA: biotin/lipoyl-binding protein [Caldisericia bacterium]|mgnify:CR=1 FL=1|jgi:biotin carboxyl carrier protein|nr:biotin/lipoyl-binding protein [Caldisericia bacterium]MBP8708358.1 biotin/lipoyl-binding protein [Caldisericia bacterium]HOC52954.1 biotin/lipoyl-binding protein [Caldisericia bacterium]HPB33412.1 biotin/lipoyl-binding protein [Caldisericia bacterium]HQL66806.1 biotin/lipoyl-binding protein [Caldisericia bacterium]